MKAIQKLLSLAVVMTTFGLCFSTSAQNSDREEIQRQTERLRQPLGMTDNDEWAIISERLARVIELRNAGRGGGGGNRDDRGRGGRGRGQGGRDRDQADRGQGDRDRNRDGAQADRGDRERGKGGGNRGGRGRDQGDRGQNDRDRDGRDGGRGGSFDPNSPQGRLQTALDRKASESELNLLLKAFRAERESNARKLEQARAALREVVTVRQETVLVLNRLLD